MSEIVDIPETVEEQTVKVAKVTPQERVSEQIVEQIVDAPVIREQQVLTIQNTFPMLLSIFGR